MTIKGKNQIELKDILIGEVWVGSGQSNMEWPVIASQGGKETIKAAKFSQIRLFHVPKVSTKTPARDVNATWKVCSPETLPHFSGVLYYFGLRLHQDLNVPVGLINSSWGGSPIEPWTVTEKGSGGMHNGMIAPLQPFAIRGVIWYQGETNVFQKNGLKYYAKMKDLIEGWRKVWGEKMPFYYVQIAPWANYPKGELAPLWEAQVAALKIPHTGMAVTTDIVHNIGDIHPINKKDVGNRLALWALAKTYGKKDLVYSGPLYMGMKVEDGRIRLNFAHTGAGLVARDGKLLSEFQVAGKDGKFVPARAVIDGQTVLVSAEGVAEPMQVRFGWHKKTNPNLMNKEGLPASPFQTDHWQGGTGG
jgi:sialate O-acetylesterase